MDVLSSHELIWHQAAWKSYYFDICSYVLSMIFCYVTPLWERQRTLESGLKNLSVIECRRSFFVFQWMNISFRPQDSEPEKILRGKTLQIKHF